MEPIRPGETPEISLTEDAKTKLNEVVENQPRPVAGLRLQIAGRINGEFQHVLSIVEDESLVEGDTVVEVESLRIFVEPRSVAYVHDLQIHYAPKGPGQSGLEYFNPNPLWFDEREQQIQEIFDQSINPAIASHGGMVSLLGVEGDTAVVQLGGGCQGCGMADVTLKQGIETTIVENVPGIERVIDQTDHASGTNPYYQPAKK